MKSWKWWGERRAPSRGCFARQSSPGTWSWHVNTEDDDNGDNNGEDDDDDCDDDEKGRIGWVGTLSTSNFQIFPSPCFWSRRFQHYYRRFTFHFHLKNDQIIFTFISREDKSYTFVICPQDMICPDQWSTGVISEDQFPPSPSHQSHLFSLLSFLHVDKNTRIANMICWCQFRWFRWMKPLGNRTKSYLVPGSSLSRRKLNFCLSGPMRPVQFRFCEKMTIIIIIVVLHFHCHDPAQLNSQLLMMLFTFFCMFGIFNLFSPYVSSSGEFLSWKKNSMNKQHRHCTEMESFYFDLCAN